MGLPKSAQIVASIDDLLNLILFRLPIKSLVRFSTVSTHWYDLITDPEFHYLRHHPKSNPALGLFLFGHNYELRPPLYDYIPFSVESPSNPPCQWRLQFDDAEYGVAIEQSCNGLLLCRSHRPCGDFNDKYYLYNPTLNRFASLPKPPDKELESTKTIHQMNLAFDPAKSPHYKVVCVEAVELLNTGGEYAHYLDVYSSETGLWKVSIEEPFTAVLYSRYGVYWNGSLHWMCHYEPAASVYFVIDEDRLETLPIPVDLDERKNYRLWESCDHLHMIAGREEIEFNVYEIKRDYSEWFIKYRVDLSHLAPAFPGMIQSNQRYWVLLIFCVIRGEKDEDDFLVFKLLGKVVTYNFVFKTFRELGRCDLKFPADHAFQYIESLCWV